MTSHRSDTGCNGLCRQWIGAQHAQEALGRILDLRRVPDFSSLHQDDDGVKQLWKLRRSSDAKALRKWFHENVRDKPEEAEALFVDTLVKPTLGDSKVVRGLRFFAFSGVPEAVGLVTGVPGVGLLASAADSLLVDRFLRPKGPKVMIDRLRGILPEPCRE